MVFGGLTYPSAGSRGRARVTTTYRFKAPIYAITMAQLSAKLLMQMSQEGGFDNGVFIERRPCRRSSKRRES